MPPDPELVDPDPDVVVEHALRQPASLGRGRLVCVDGPAGSGKTTLADQIVLSGRARDLTAAVVHMDDLYEGWGGLDLGPEERILAQLLEPMAEARPGRWQRYNWYAGRFDEWVGQPLVDVLVLEGCGSGALAYAPYRSLLVWIEADRDLRVQRGIERAGEEVLTHWLAWMESEARNFAANDTRAHADLRFSTDPRDSADLGRQ